MRTPAPFLLTLLLPCLSLAAQEKVTLRYALTPGQVTWSQMTQEMTHRMSVQGKEMNRTLSRSMWLETKTIEVKDDVASLESRYARVTVKGDGPGIGKIDYDSDVEGSKAGAMRGLTDLAGKTAKMKVDTRGNVSEFSMHEELEAQMERIGMSLKQGFEQSITSWPKDAIGIGESWSSNLDFPMDSMGTMKAAVTNKLVAVKDQVVTVEQTMVMDTSGVKMPGTLKLEVTKATGVTKISLASTMPIEGSMDMEMKMDGGKDAPMNMSMTQRTVMKQIEAPAPKKPAEAPKTGDGK